MWRELLNRFEAAKTPEEQAVMTREAIRVMLKDLADYEDPELGSRQAEIIKPLSLFKPSA